MASTHLEKPRLRGVLHQYGFFVSVLAGCALVVAAGDARSRVACAIYAASLSGLFGVSALYHRVSWADRIARWMKRADHAMIFVLIAGTFTPFALLAMHGAVRTVVVAGVWGGALAMIVREVAWVDAPRWISPVACVVLGWTAVAGMPQLWDTIGGAGVGLVALGGIVYTLGAVAYALQRPNPVPGVFGFHEVFHLCTVVAAAAHYAAIAGFVLPRT